MAEHDEGAERTEQPSERRLRQARERGQSPRSRELANAAVVGAAALALWPLGGMLARGATEWMRKTLAWRALPAAPELPAWFAGRLLELLLVAAPLIGVCLLATLVAPAIMGSLGFAPKALAPDIGRLDPLRNLKNIYSREGLAELVRSLLRVALIGGFAGMAVAGALPKLMALVHHPLPTAAADGLGIVLKVLIALVAALAVLAALDVPYQRWSHRKQLMMTRQEVKEEMKETEGRPEVKARIRRMQHEVAQRRMMEDVPRADVILVNPTHYAVALAYDAAKMRAPRVVAKGVDLIAQTIREVGERHGVPIVSSPPLARALYRQARIGEEIPVTLYAAVAQILGYVYQLRAWRRDGGRPPELPAIDVPEGGEP